MFLMVLGALLTFSSPDVSLWRFVVLPTSEVLDSSKFEERRLGAIVNMKQNRRLEHNDQEKIQDKDANENSA